MSRVDLRRNDQDSLCHLSASLFSSSFFSDSLLSQMSFFIILGAECLWLLIQSAFGTYNVLGTEYCEHRCKQEKIWPSWSLHSLSQASHQFVNTYLPIHKKKKKAKLKDAVEKQNRRHTHTRQKSSEKHKVVSCSGEVYCYYVCASLISFLIFCFFLFF